MFKVTLISMNLWEAEVEAGKLVIVTDAKCALTIIYIVFDKDTTENLQSYTYVIVNETKKNSLDEGGVTELMNLIEFNNSIQI